MSEPRRHVLIWVAPEFLKSSGMIQLFTEASIFLPPQNDLEEYIRSAEAAGGFAMTGRLAEANHGAGIWISPVNVPGLELMIPWHLVKSVVTAESTQSSKAFGLMSDLAQSNTAVKKQRERSTSRNNVK
jgi:hypothetical protein